MLVAMTEAWTDARTATPVHAISRAERLVGGWVDSPVDGGPSRRPRRSCSGCPG